MNTIDSNFDSPRPVSTSNASKPTQVMPSLLKREYWEHRGGFLWAPMVASGLFILFMLMGIVLGETMANRSGANLDLTVNGVNMERLNSVQHAQSAAALNGVLYAPITWAMMVLAFVVFFYCLGALFDDRKDRSILFWKSLPISDTATVLSKVLSAIVMAPLIAAVIGLITMLVFMGIASAVMMYHGGHPLQMIWGLGSPLTIVANIIGSIPVYAAWSLPTVGWLLMISAWSRSKPFLWAVMVPVLAGILVNWFQLMQFFNLSSSWFWRHIVGRLLLSAVPGSDLVLPDNGLQQLSRFEHGPEALMAVLSLKRAYAEFATLDMWIGIAVGVAMIFVAIRLRRWSDDS